MIIKKKINNTILINLTTFNELIMFFLREIKENLILLDPLLYQITTL